MCRMPARPPTPLDAVRHHNVDVRHVMVHRRHPIHLRHTKGKQGHRGLYGGPSVRPAGELRGVLGRIDQSEINHQQAKIAQALDHLVDRYGRRTQRGWEVTLEINRQDLANMAGTTRETVSRVFRTLKDEGVIEDEERRLVVLDRERLRAFFEES